jgi:NAD(P)-dependent dehydrogenase (short-subunit alcohol dehydrogenase family)
MNSRVTSFRQIDLGDRQAPRWLCGELIQEDPPINVLVNNAGIFTANAAEVFEPDGFWNTLAVNLYTRQHLLSPLDVACANEGKVAS